MNKKQGKMPTPFEKAYAAARERAERTSTQSPKTGTTTNPTGSKSRTSTARSHAIPRRYADATLDQFPFGSPTYIDGLYVTGDTGTGKTHFAAAVVNAWLEDHETGYPPPQIWHRATDMIMMIKDTFDSKADTHARIIGRWRKAPILVIDDIGAEQQTDFAAAIIYAVISGRIDDMRPTIVTSNIEARDIDDARLASRLASLTNIKMAGGDRRKKKGTR